MSEVYAWLAVKGASAEEACASLGLERSGADCDYLDAEVSGATLSTGWYVVVVGSEMFDFFMDFSLEELSRSHDLAILDVEEHVMYFNLAYWADGARQWNLAHDGQEGVYHLEAEGELPGDFDALKAEYVGKQDEAGGEDAGVDYLSEVPLELARRVTGFRYNFRHDQEPEFEELDLPDDFDEAAVPPRPADFGEDEPEPGPSPQLEPEASPQPDHQAEPPEPSRLERLLLKWFGR